MIDVINVLTILGQLHQRIETTPTVLYCDVVCCGLLD